MSTKKSFVTKKRIKSWCSYASKVIVGLFIIFPVLVCICSALKTESQLLTSRGWELILLPANPTLENFIEAWTTIPLGKFLMNTAIQCTIVIISQVILCSFAAYALVFFDFKGKELLFAFILFTMMIPGDVVIISNYIQIQAWHLTDTHLGMALPHLVGGMGIFLMRQFYLTIPHELRDAAAVDGCGDFRFFMSVALPLSIPSLSALSIREFVIIYNRYFWPLLVTNKEAKRTIQLGIALLRSNEFVQVTLDMASAAICIIPVVFVFIIGQKYIIKGMTAGAVKG